jgi:small subunit ribosomal protein S24e
MLEHNITEVTRMEMKIITDVKNPLLERREVEAVVEFDGPTPSKNEILVELSKKLKVKDTHVEIEKVWQRFGRQEAKIIAFVYDKPIREEKAEVKEEAEEEKSAEQVAEEQKQEESKEEKEEAKTEEQKEDVKEESEGEAQEDKSSEQNDAGAQEKQE